MFHTYFWKLETVDDLEIKLDNITIEYTKKTYVL